MPYTKTLRIGLLCAGALSVACGSDSSSSGASAGAPSSAAGANSSPAGAGGASAGTSGSGGGPIGGGGSPIAGAGASNPSGGSSGAAVAGNGGSSNGGSNNGGSSNGGSGGAAAGAGGKGGNPGSAGSAGAPTGNCPAVDPLKTNNAKQDAFDCTILDVSKKWGMPDPMIVKSQILQESSFQEFATSGDSPCGIMNGWTDAESKSFGLIQTTPACGEALTARLANGHPNLTKDTQAALWANSVFNPAINLDEGVKTDVDNLKALKQKYAGCTAIQYNMMAAGAFNSGTGAILGCGSYNARAQTYVTLITSHYHQFAKAAGWPDPYL